MFYLCENRSRSHAIFFGNFLYSWMLKTTKPYIIVNVDLSGVNVFNAVVAAGLRPVFQTGIDFLSKLVELTKIR